MTKTPPVNDYHATREAELELELALDALASKTAKVRRACMDARKAGQTAEADALDKELQELRAERRALILQG